MLSRGETLGRTEGQNIKLESKINSFKKMLDFEMKTDKQTELKTFSIRLGKAVKELRCCAFISLKCSFTAGVLPDERIVSRYVEQSRRVTVGLISWHWLHHSDQLPPVMTTENQH